MLATPLAAFPFLSPLGMLELWERFRVVAREVLADERLAARVESRQLRSGLMPEHWFEGLRDESPEEVADEVFLFRCLVRQPLDGAWAEDLDRLPHQEGWTGYVAEWGVLAETEEDALARGVGMQSQCHEVPPKDFGRSVTRGRSRTSRAWSGRGGDSRRNRTWGGRRRTTSSREEGVGGAHQCLATTEIGGCDCRKSIALLDKPAVAHQKQGVTEHCITPTHPPCGHLLPHSADSRRDSESKVGEKGLCGACSNCAHRGCVKGGSTSRTVRSPNGIFHRPVSGGDTLSSRDFGDERSQT